MNPGDIYYHKATLKRCVIAEPWNDNQVRVTTEDGKSAVYHTVELWTEAEYNEKYGNTF